MRLTAYRTASDPPVIRPASPRRAWMDQTHEKFAYRCLPLTMGSQFGWELLCPCTFEARWHGGTSTRAITIVPLGSGARHVPESHFGGGILTIHPCHLFRTEAPYSLFVTGPANVRKDGIVPLTAVVETDWLPFTFTMNWAFTRPGVTVRFEEGEPFCQFFPVQSELLEQVEPEIRDIESSPRLMRQYREWTTSRNTFNAELRVEGSEAQARKWQQFYSRGTLHTGEKSATRHRTRLHLRPFVEASLEEVEREDDEVAVRDDTPENPMAVSCPYSRNGGGAAASVLAAPPAMEVVEAGSILVAHPAAEVEEAEDRSVVLCNRASGTRLRISRPLYDLFLQLSQPRVLTEILPAEPPRQERALGYIRLLAHKGFLVSPS